MGQKVIIIKSTGDLTNDLKTYNEFKKSSSAHCVHCFQKINEYILQNYGSDISTDREVEIFTRILEIFYQQDSFWFVKYVLEELERLENEPIVYVFSLNFTSPILLKKFISNTEDIKFVKGEELTKIPKMSVSNAKFDIPKGLSVHLIQQLSKKNLEKINKNLLSIISRIVIYNINHKLNMQRREVICQLIYSVLV